MTKVFEIPVIASFEEATLALAYLSAIFGTTVNLLVQKGIVTDEEVGKILTNAHNLFYTGDHSGSC